MDVANVFIGRSKKYNQYIEGKLKDNQSCKSCIRKHFSFPYTCNDGWPMGDPSWVDRGSKCINWTDDSNCKVD